MRIRCTQYSLSRVGLLATLVTLFLVEPVLANKFETISGGMAGSSGIKREWLKGFLLVVAGISLLSAVLAVVVPHKNALYSNATNWKTSFAILISLTAAFGSAAFLI